ncbi:MAG: hypothetical protein Q7S13_03880, partial [Candidatus Omnitrophota bacterium]|nr:hypothetical protein [Candidatus Omnitrophota bacterium]
VTTGRIHYVLPEDALVRIRIGQDGPLFRTLLDWEKREKGAHDEIWDFKDETGKVDFSTWKNFKIIFSARNVDSSTSNPSIPVGLHKAPKIHISFPEIDMPDDKIVLRGMASIRATVDEADFKWLSNSKIENIIFMDGVFLHEEEEGNNPFNYQLDTRLYNNGPHVLIINTVSYAGETGTAALTINIGN